MKLLTNEEYMCKLDYYKDLLKLNDWGVELQTKVPRGMFINVGSCGETTWNITTRKATIKICDETTMLPEELEDYDEEVTLVHELLHLKFGLIADFSSEVETLHDKIAHRIINDLAYAIVENKK